MKPILLFACLLTLCGCQSSGTSTWRKPGYFGAPKTSMSVVVLAYRPEMREQFENAIAAELRKSGVDAKTSYQTISTQSLLANKPAALDSLKHTNVESVFVARLADPKTLESVSISPANSGATMQPWQNWFDYFTAPSAFAVGPASMAAGGKIGIQAVLYESPSGTLLWSATRVSNANTTGNSAKAFAGTVAQDLKKAALVP
ncbi:MAG: hypothetical protein ACOYM3_10740 [Terrimicrobiaceae bacterium]